MFHARNKSEVKVKVRWSSPFIFGVEGGVIELPGEDPTLRTLLTELSNNIEGEVPLLDPKRNSVHPPFAVRLNGELHVFLSQGLDTKLEDGDSVEIVISGFGGG